MFRPIPMMVASSTCSNRIPAILAPLTSTSLGHFSMERICRGNRGSTVSATAIAARKISSGGRVGGWGVGGGGGGGGERKNRKKKNGRGGGQTQVWVSRPRPAVCSSAWM